MTSTQKAEFDRLVEALGPVRLGDLDEVRYGAFTWFCNISEGSLYICWQCSQQYRLNPNKRKAIFIYDTFLDQNSREENALLGTINTGGSGEANPQRAVADTIANIKLVKTWVGKLRHRDLVAQYAHPTENLFAALEERVAEDIGQVMANVVGNVKGGSKSQFVFEERTRYSVKDHYERAVPDASRKLTAATFDPEAMGVW